MPLKRKLRDWAMYLAIAIGIVGGAVSLPLWLPESRLPSRTWFVFGVATVFLCVFIAKMYWNRRKSPKTWALLSLILIVHISGYSILLDHFPNFPDISFLISVPLEVMLIILIVKLCLHIMPQRVKL